MSTQFNLSSSHAYRSTQFPAFPKIPLSYIALIDRFCALIDTLADNGAQIAAEIFTPTAVWKNSLGTHKGVPEIARSREKPLDGMRAIKHDVLKVFAFDEGGKEIMLLVRLIADWEHGKQEWIDSVGRFEIVDTEDGPRCSFLQGWVWREPKS